MEKKRSFPSFFSSALYIVISSSAPIGGVANNREVCIGDEQFVKQRMVNADTRSSEGPSRSPVSRAECIK